MQKQKTLLQFGLMAVCAESLHSPRRRPLSTLEIEPI